MPRFSRGRAALVAEQSLSRFIEKDNSTVFIGQDGAEPEFVQYGTEIAAALLHLAQQLGKPSFGPLAFRHAPLNRKTLDDVAVPVTHRRDVPRDEVLAAVLAVIDSLRGESFSPGRWFRAGA